LLFSEARLAPEDLKQYASKMGLDTVKFDTCVSNGSHKLAVQRDLDEGTRLGVTGTPAFFINGRLISGAQSFEAFARIIDDELARVTASLSGSR
jgi:protein-disulfide isomerase